MRSNQCGFSGKPHRSRRRPSDAVSVGFRETEDVFGRDDLHALRSVFRQPSVVYTTTVLILGLFVWQAFTSFYPTYLVEVKGFSTTVASFLFGTFFALGLLIKPLAGSAYDRFGIRRSLTIVASGPMIGLIALPYVDDLWIRITITALVSTLLGFATVVEPSLLHSLPEEIRGTGFGILRSVGFTTGAASPVLFGAVADRGFFDEMFTVLAVFAAGMVLLAFRISEN
jgi:sugar phosphate permease